jgi:uncharacterized membrane protein
MSKWTNNPIDGRDVINSNILRAVEIEKEQKAKQTPGERISNAIAAFAGSMIFVYIHVIWFGAWILANTIFLRKPFDPFPFTFLTLIVSLEAIFLSTFILISQNHETRLTERRNQLDLQINLLAERESTKTLELLKEIAHKVGVDHEDAELDELTNQVDPRDLIHEIQTATE